MMNQDGKTLIKATVLILFISVIVGYSYFQSRNLLRGPQITITTPANGETLANPLVAIKGSAENISFLSLNDRQIFVDTKGNFNEELLLSPGYNVWKLEAKDKFGRIVSKKIELVLNKNL